MRRLLDTLPDLDALTRFGAMPGAHGVNPLSPYRDFGTNPGALLAYSFVPDDLARGAPLVVVLHGCTQNASGYDRGAGWSRLAAEQGFALLFAEQQRANNANLCFNWFERGDIARGGGELESIAQMTRAMTAAFELDPARVFITGLSAGGAMTAAMLASYPELFAGGAVIAGLPFGGAPGVQAALQQMRRASGGGSAAVRAASAHAGVWPTLSVWHGSADRTVDIGNAAALIEQWRPLHGVASAPSRRERVEGHARDIWTGADGHDVIESWTIEGMGHGTPLAASGPDACGLAGPHMLDVGLSSTRHIARFWGLHARVAKPEPIKRAARSAEPKRAAHGPQKVIEDALRAAGLMR